MEIFVVYLGYTEKRYFFPLFLRKEESLLVHLPHLDPLQYRVKSNPRRSLFKARQVIEWTTPWLVLALREHAARDGVGDAADAGR